MLSAPVVRSGYSSTCISAMAFLHDGCAQLACGGFKSVLCTGESRTWSEGIAHRVAATASFSIFPALDAANIAVPASSMPSWSINFVKNAGACRTPSRVVRCCGSFYDDAGPMLSICRMRKLFSSVNCSSSVRSSKNVGRNRSSLSLLLTSIRCTGADLWGFATKTSVD